MRLATLHALRARQWLQLLRLWMQGKGLPWTAELTGAYDGQDLGMDLKETDEATLTRTGPQPDFAQDNLYSYKRELEQQFALNRDTLYGRRNRQWLWRRGVQLRVAGYRNDWTAHVRRNAGPNLLVVLATNPTRADQVKLKDVL